jgi:hypothetical protein
MAINFKITIFGVMTLCNLVDTCMLVRGKPGIYHPHIIIILIFLKTQNKKETYKLLVSKIKIIFFKYYYSVLNTLGQSE